MKNPDWRELEFQWDRERRDRRHQENLNRSADEAQKIREAGFERVEEVEIVLHANESNAMLIVLGDIVKDKRGRKFFRHRGSNELEPYDKKKVEKYQEQRLRELEGD